ncbi:MAG: response regulator [Candidatus Krumholzibacteriia bacterium]
MAKKLDTTSLFLAQVTHHSDELNGLLGLPPNHPAARARFERSILSTNMLANSFSLLELELWQSFLEAFEGLLITYRDKNLPWDERIAQVTSEIIEKEDQLLTHAQTKPPSALANIVSADEVNSMLEELVELQSTAAAATAPPPTAPGPAPAAGTQPEAIHEDAVAIKTAEEERSLGSSMGELCRNAQSLIGHWRSSEWDLVDGAPAGFDQIRRELLLTSFHALSIEQMIAIKGGNRGPLTIASLAPIRATLEDFVRVMCLGTDRHIDVAFEGEDNELHASLLFPVVRVLQFMIGDVFARCSDDYLHIEVAAEKRYGAFRWSMRDNGSNFISDSQLDPDEYLAFYPGLKETCKVLSELRSLLWVEPDETHDTRFAFTMPVSVDGGRFMVWGDGGQRMAVHANQVDKVIPFGDAEIKSGARGEHLVMGGNVVPLVRLGQLYTGAPVDGGHIAVIGRLEKRIAFPVSTAGDPKEGKWSRNAIPAWRGMERGVAEIAGHRVPLVEADSLVRRYLQIINTVSPTELSGGTGGQDPDLSQAQADMEKVDPIPPAQPPQASAQVLVVERSEVLGNAFTTILSQDGLTTQVVNKLDEAIDLCLQETAPILIISEFRVPSMAAKVLAERLQSEGKNIPVLVTTTHRGQNAERLVEKIGVAGYISKPLDAEDVLARVGGFFS